MPYIHSRLSMFPMIIIVDLLETLMMCLFRALVMADYVAMAIFGIIVPEHIISVSKWP